MNAYVQCEVTRVEPVHVVRVNNRHAHYYQTEAAGVLQILNLGEIIHI